MVLCGGECVGLSSFDGVQICCIAGASLRGVLVSTVYLHHKTYDSNEGKPTTFVPRILLQRSWRVLLSPFVNLNPTALPPNEIAYAESPVKPLAHQHSTRQDVINTKTGSKKEPQQEIASDQAPIHWTIGRLLNRWSLFLSIPHPSVAFVAWAFSLKAPRQEF